MLERKKLFWVLILSTVFLFCPSIKASELTEEQYMQLGITRAYIVGNYIFDLQQYNPNLNDFITAATTIVGQENIKVIEIKIAEDLAGNIVKSYKNVAIAGETMTEFPKINTKYVYMSAIDLINSAKEKKRGMLVSPQFVISVNLQKGVGVSNNRQRLYNVCVQKLDNVDGVEIYYSNTKEGKYNKINLENEKADGTLCGNISVVDGTYFFKSRSLIKSVNGTQYSSFSDVKKFNTLSTIAPTVYYNNEQNLGNSTKSIDININASGTQKYNIYRAMNEGGEYSLIDTIVATYHYSEQVNENIENTKYQTTIPDKANYFYKVLGVSEDTYGKYYTNPTIIEYNNSNLGAPSISKSSVGISGDSNSINFVLTINTKNVDGYELYSSSCDDCQYILINTSSSGTENMILTKKGNYRFRARSYKIINNVKIYSNYSNVINVNFSGINNPVLSSSFAGTTLYEQLGYAITIENNQNIDGYYVYKYKKDPSGNYNLQIVDHMMNYQKIQKSNFSYYGLNNNILYFASIDDCGDYKYSFKLYKLDAEGNEIYSDYSEVIIPTIACNESFTLELPTLSERNVRLDNGDIKTNIEIISNDKSVNFQLYVSDTIDGEYVADNLRVSFVSDIPGQATIAYNNNEILSKKFYKIKAVRNYGLKTLYSKLSTKAFSKISSNLGIVSN